MKLIFVVSFFLPADIGKLLVYISFFGLVYFAMFHLPCLTGVPIKNAIHPGWSPLQVRLQELAIICLEFFFAPRVRSEAPRGRAAIKTSIEVFSIVFFLGVGGWVHQYDV